MDFLSSIFVTRSSIMLWQISVSPNLVRTAKDFDNDDEKTSGSVAFDSG
jgi:hypothetical protein